MVEVIKAWYKVETVFERKYSWVQMVAVVVVVLMKVRPCEYVNGVSIRPILKTFSHSQGKRKDEAFHQYEFGYVEYDVPI
jgi:hypothetical protein